MSTVDFKKRSLAEAMTSGGSYPDFVPAKATEPGSQDTLYHGGNLGGMMVWKAASSAEKGSKAVDGLCVPLWKRLLDLTCILLSMPFWLPIMALVSVWIKIVSPGPVLFRQTRIGLGGRRFTILKFRSMKVNAETRSHHHHLQKLMASDVPMAKLDVLGDPRLILGGKWMRSLGLDELPQLINVIWGEMSLVGPRPCTPTEFERYDNDQKNRVKAVPGLTGYWQVNGKNKTTFRQMISLDLHYVEHLSLSLDLAILMATIPAMFLQHVESRGTVRGKAAQTHGETAAPSVKRLMEPVS